LGYDFRSDPILSQAFDYWRGKCGARSMPQRRDIDPTEIPRLLPHIQITENVGARIRYRLAGSAIVEAYGGELKGKFFDEVLSGERLRFVEANHRLVCTEKRPILVSGSYLSKKEIPLVCNRVVMPLSEDGVNVNQCFTVMTFQFPGKASEWFGQWSGNSGNFDFARSHCEIIRD